MCTTNSCKFTNIAKTSDIFADCVHVGNVNANIVNMQRFTHQIKSLQCPQNVGCLKKRWTILWSFTTATFFCLKAPRLCTPFLSVSAILPELIATRTLCESPMYCAWGGLILYILEHGQTKMKVEVSNTTPICGCVLQLNCREKNWSQ